MEHEKAKLVDDIAALNLKKTNATEELKKYEQEIEEKKKNESDIFTKFKADIKKKTITIKQLNDFIKETNKNMKIYFISALLSGVAFIFILYFCLTGFNNQLFIQLLA